MSDTDSSPKTEIHTGRAVPPDTDMSTTTTGTNVPTPEDPAARSSNDTETDNQEQPPSIKVPRTAMLLGLDFETNTYHWEGPLGLPLETLPGKLFGPLRGWSRLDHRYTTLSPELRVDEPVFYLMNPDVEDFRTVDGDESVFAVVDKDDGRELFEIPRNLLLAVRPNPAGTLETLVFKRSPYALAAFRRGVPALLIE
ncbi:hypothetical protein BR93DRAFT_389950 [Coniochaeta sp. PMI_546]|nr:hypothetical protein BR93DRAFT_389950 [Coniochaeta sp. PMI_546]